MSGGEREYKKGGGGYDGGGGDDGGAVGGIDPRQVHMMRLIRAARQWNAQHAELAAEFQRLTGIDPQAIRAVRAWQLQHNQRGDGKIGKETLQAAKQAAGEASEGEAMGHDHARRPHHHHEPEPQQEPAQSVSFSDEEAGTITAAAPEQASAPGGPVNHELAAQTFGHYADPPTIGPEPAKEGSGLAGELVAGGSTASEEHREEDAEESKEQGGKYVSDGIEHASEAAGLEGGAGVGVRGAAQLARIPHLMHLIKEKKYKEAFSYITETIGYADKLEAAKFIAEHAGIELAELLPKVMKAATIGAETADIVLAGLTFQCEALKALDEAHVKGERDNRIYLYAEAWADGFLEGATSAGEGAIEDSQRKAVADGVREGKATAGHLGEKAADVGKQLLKQYGDEANARRALIDALLEHAGIDDIKLHEGK